MRRSWDRIRPLQLQESVRVSGSLWGGNRGGRGDRIDSRDTNDHGAHAGAIRQESQDRGRSSGLFRDLVRHQAQSLQHPPRLLSPSAPTVPPSAGTDQVGLTDPPECGDGSGSGVRYWIEPFAISEGSCASPGSCALIRAARSSSRRTRVSWIAMACAGVIGGRS
jgi:hypothetical protein